MATKIIKAWINGSVQDIEVEDIISSELMPSVEERLDILEDKHEVVITDGNFLIGNGTEDMEEITPEEVLSHINGASVMTMTTAEFEALEETNANTLYMMTDDDDRPDWNQTDEEAADYIKNKPNIDGIVDDLNIRIDETNESVKAITFESIGAAASNHNHDDVYYTEIEVDEKIKEISNVVTDLSNTTSINYDESIIGLSVDDTTITYIKGDGSVHTFETQDTDTTYSLATDETTGLTKLYATTGSAEDGTMTQKAIKTELDKKVGVSIDSGNNMLIFTI